MRLSGRNALACMITSRFVGEWNDLTHGPWTVRLTISLMRCILLEYCQAFPEFLYLGTGEVSQAECDQ